LITVVVGVSVRRTTSFGSRGTFRQGESYPTNLSMCCALHVRRVTRAPPTPPQSGTPERHWMECFTVGCLHHTFCVRQDALSFPSLTSLATSQNALGIFIFDRRNFTSRELRRVIYTLIVFVSLFLLSRWYT